MTVSYLELLEMIKAYKQPKKVKYNEVVYVWEDGNFTDDNGEKLLNKTIVENYTDYGLAILDDIEVIEDPVLTDKERKYLSAVIKPLMFQNAYSYSQKMESRAIILETQQKEFIKYLEDEIEQNTPKLRWKHFNEDGLNDYDVENPIYIENQPTNKVLKEILKKYKSIIGDDE